MTKDRYVLLIDIMGFSDLVLTGDRKEIQKAALALSEVSDDVGSFSYPGKDGKARKVDTALFSDTILAWTEETDLDDAAAILYAALKLTCSLFEKNLPFRGAIAMGEFAADKEKSIYVGRPLVDAHRLSNSLEFFGTVLHHTVDQKLPRQQVPGSGYGWVPVPVKKGGWIKHSTVFPLRDSNMFPEVSKPLDSYLEQLFHKSSGETRKYIQNSEKVYGSLRSLIETPQTG